MLQGLLSKHMMETFFKKTIIATTLKEDERYKSWEDIKDAII